MYRIGLGYDIHTLKEGRALILGGVHISFERGLDGHSDADALLHAITDALLGAAALGDIGLHFPDTENRWLNADSRVLLKAAYQLVLEKGYVINNLDTTIIAEAPKMRPHIPAMIDNLCLDLNLDKHQVNIKAKTNEKMDAIGQKEAIAAQAIVMLKRMDNAA